MTESREYKGYVTISEPRQDEEGLWHADGRILKDGKLVAQIIDGEVVEWRE